MFVRAMFFAAATVPLYAALCASAAEPRTQNVFLITSDGLRWQEVFHGGDQTLLNHEVGGVENPVVARMTYLRNSAEERRKTLMPFFWGTVAQNGQIYGDREHGSSAHITNTIKLSYPGYNEILTGKADPKIVSNESKLNANVSVLEWLNNQPKFGDKVAAFSAWDAMPFILNRPRCRFPVFGGSEPVPDKDPDARQQALNDLLTEITPPISFETYDALVYEATMEHLRRHKPRVLFASFVETDHWAHAGRYDLVLRAARSYDSYVQKLWEYAQSTPEYKGTTTFILVTDHGRGSGIEHWKTHGPDIEGAENIWMAFMGPDTPPLGLRHDVATVTQSQVAATLAALLGHDYHAAAPDSGTAIQDVLGNSR